MTSLKTSIKTITYLSDIGCLEIQGASLVTIYGKLLNYVCEPGVSQEFPHNVALSLSPFSPWKPPGMPQSFGQFLDR